MKSGSFLRIESSIFTIRDEKSENYATCNLLTVQILTKISECSKFKFNLSFPWSDKSGISVSLKYDFLPKNMESVKEMCYPYCFRRLSRVTANLNPFA